MTTPIQSMPRPTQPRGEISKELQMAANLLRNAQKPSMQVTAFQKEIEFLDKELQRTHETLRAKLAIHQSTYDEDKRLKDLNLRLELAISKFHALAKEADCVKVENPAFAPLVHPSDAGKPQMDAHNDESKGLHPKE